MIIFFLTWNWKFLLFSHNAVTKSENEYWALQWPIQVYQLTLLQFLPLSVNLIYFTGYKCIGVS